MDLANPCRPASRKRLKSIHDFLAAHPNLLERLPRASQNAFIKLCGYASHLRSRRAIEFFMQVFTILESLQTEHERNKVLTGAMILGSYNWTLVLSYLGAVNSIPAEIDNFDRWLRCTRRLCEADIDVAIAFLDQTPKAIRSIGFESLMFCGNQARRSLDYGQHMWKATKAYIEERIANRCNVSDERWIFSLRLAAFIAEQSPDAAEEFIRYGSLVCLLLDEKNTRDWVNEGLNKCSNQTELINYFSGRSLNALDVRDTLVTGETLKTRVGALSLICEALLGRPIKIQSNRSLVGVKGFTFGAVTDGRAIYLPEVVPTFQLMKLMMLHQASLLDMNGLIDNCKTGEFSMPELHLKADQRLCELLPGIGNQMHVLGSSLINANYPECDSSELPTDLPWWGDILPEFIEDTNRTVRKLRKKVSKAIDLAPEVLEALINSIMAQGERDSDALATQLENLLDNFDFESPDAEELDKNIKTFFYKEWDANLSDYKVDWCLVRRRLTESEPNPFAEDVRNRLSGIIRLIKNQFMKLKPETFKKYKAQPFGDEIDIDALINSYTEMKSGSYLSDNIYIRRDKRVRDVAVLFLIDMSGSTEEMVNGQRVIDIQKEAMVLMAEALQSLGDEFSIFGFSSEGRFRVDLFCVKNFHEEFNDTVRYRLGNLEPKQLTRMGAVIRHGISEFANISAVHKLMVILTDGRPYDLEYGGLDYAMADTRKALKEARVKNIRPFIITSDKKGAQYLRRICSQTQSIILPRAEILPRVLPALYKRLTF